MSLFFLSSNYSILPVNKFRSWRELWAFVFDKELLKFDSTNCSKARDELAIGSTGMLGPSLGWQNLNIQSAIFLNYPS